MTNTIETKNKEQDEEPAPSRCGWRRVLKRRIDEDEEEEVDDLEKEKDEDEKDWLRLTLSIE